jgi:hypothetical protein
MGTRALLPIISSVVYWDLLYAMSILFLLVMIRTWLRRDWAVAVAAILLPFVLRVGAGADLDFILQSLLVSAISVTVLMRFGLLAYLAYAVFGDLLSTFPITPQPSAWYSGIGLTGAILLLAMAGYAFNTALGGQPVFGRTPFED